MLYYVGFRAVTTNDQQFFLKFGQFKVVKIGVFRPPA